MALTKPDEKNIEHLYLIVVLSFRHAVDNQSMRAGQIDIAGYIIYRVLLHYKYLKAVGLLNCCWKNLFA
jgi:hypothetical protein